MRAALWIVAALLPAPVMAEGKPATRLVHCGEQVCLKIAGQRASAVTPVRVAGHALVVQGGRRWHVELPVETVRSWASPFTRTIEVALDDADPARATVHDADLPIGLMGHVNLAALIVRVH